MLKDIFAEIDRLEKTTIDTRNFSATEDDYMPWSVAALALFAAGLLLRLTVLRTMP